MENGLYSLHSAFASAANFIADDGAFLSLVSAEKGGGPFNICLSGCAFASVRFVEVHLPRLIVDGLELELDSVPAYDSSVAAFRHPRIGSGELAVLEKAYLKSATSLSMAFVLDSSRLRHFISGFERGFAERALNGCASFSARDYALAARTLNGTGFGFTPSGDDFIAGLLLATHFSSAGAQVREIIAAEKPGSNPVSAAACRAACGGCASAPVKQLLRELQVCGTSRGLAEVLKIGSTSGADLLAGFIFA
ncbi:MAG: DUF2877 domain-containing protein, partial [Elusimicrobia bacterium]|nr:DUF2877 domain-containing protein [Elusimicrobiota bacterium]